MLQMLQLGLIDIDYARGKRLTVTPYGMDVVKGLRRIELTKYVSPTARALAATKPKQPASDQQRLLAVLKQVRKAEAAKAGMPPYLVFSDATLTDMAARAPLTMEQFALVSGVGEKKLVRFWRPFVDAIRRFKSINN